MPASYDDHTLTFFAADFPPDFGDRLPICASSLNRTYKPDDVNFRPGSNYVFKWWGKRKLLLLTNKRLGFQTLGLNTWRQELETFARIVSDGLRALEASKLTRIGFKVVALVHQSMTHAELGDLFFGPFLAPLENWQSLVSSPADPLIQMNGEHLGMKVQLVLSSMNPEQASLSLHGMPNLDAFNKNASDTVTHRFIEKAAAVPSFLVDVDLFRENDVPIEDVSGFLQTSLKTAESVVDASLARLLSKASK
jgi:hypothetical protein